VSEKDGAKVPSAQKPDGLCPARTYPDEVVQELVAGEGCIATCMRAGTSPRAGGRVEHPPGPQWLGQFASTWPWCEPL